MELPDDYFTEDDAIRQMQADDDAAVNYRRQWEEAEMTVFLIENVIGDQELRITQNAEGMVLAVNEDGTRATTCLSAQDIQNLSHFLTDWLRRHTQEPAR